MKECLNCKKEYNGKKETSKFCSTSCRVMYNRKHGKKNALKPIQAQSLYNSMMEMIEKTNQRLDAIPTLPAPDYYDAARIITNNDEHKQWEEPKQPIRKPKTVIRYVEERVQCDDADSYDKWLEKLMSDPYLSKRDKELAKTAPLN